MVVTVDGNETFASSAESDLIALIIPPVIQFSSGDYITELNHAVDLSPTVL